MGLFWSYKSGSKKITSLELKRWLGRQRGLTSIERRDVYNALKPRLTRGLTDRELHDAIRELRRNTTDSIEHSEAKSLHQKLRHWLFG